MTGKSASLAWPLIIVALAASMYGLRLAAPSDLEGYAQYRNIGYVLDAVHNGEWLTQHDLQGRILSKPPLHTWLITTCVHAFGLNRFALTLPSFLAVTALGLLVFSFGRRQFGPLAGAFAGIFVVLAPLYSKQVAMVRSDPVFALLIAAGAWAAWRAWQSGRGWTLFWFIGALGTLTKGPLAVLLAGLGLVACFWERRADRSVPAPRPFAWKGIAVFFAVCLAWLVPALIKSGRELVDMMLVGELIGHASGVNGGQFPLSHFPKPALNVLSRFAPFSLLAFYGVWRVFFRPAPDVVERRFERFLVCTALGGLLVFSLAAHFRSDLILPLWAPFALLAGREAARLCDRVGRARFYWGLAATTVALFAFAAWTYYPSKGVRSRIVVFSEDTKAAARAITAAGIPSDQIAHVGTPSSLQFYLGSYNVWLTRDELAALSAVPRAELPRWIAVGRESPEDTPSLLATLPYAQIAEYPAEIRDRKRDLVVTLYETNQ